MRRSVAAVLLTVVVAFLARPATAKAQSAVDPDRDIQLVDAARDVVGLGALAPASDLTSIAQSHAVDMAAQQRLYHQSLAPIAGQAVGENVGVGDAIDQLHDMFMQSPAHRVNIEGDYSDIGVGVAWSADGHLYIDEVFRLPWSAATEIGPAATAPIEAPAVTTAPEVAPAADARPAPIAPEPTTEPATTTTTAPAPLVPVTVLAAQLAPKPIASGPAQRPARTDDHPLALVVFAALLAIGVLSVDVWLLRRRAV